MPFDERPDIHNEGGRVTDAGRRAPVPQSLTAGADRRVPTGIIGTNKECAQETVTLILSDLARATCSSCQVRRDELEELLDGGVEHRDLRALGAHRSPTSAASASRTGARAWLTR